MTGRVLAVSAPLWLFAAGCVDDPHLLLVAPSAGPDVAVARSLNRTTQAPATEAVAKRVIAVGHAIIQNNQQLGLRPLFITAGAPFLEIFHKGAGGIDGCQITITEGLVRRCATDAQLAAVLCLELGKVVAERAALDSMDQRPGEEHLPPDVPIGHDSTGTFGPADGTRMMEVARIEQSRRRPGQMPKLPSPDALAQQYLKRAGHDVAALQEVRPLLREAADHYELEKHMKGGSAAPVPPPPPATPAPLAPAPVK